MQIKIQFVWILFFFLLNVGVIRAENPTVKIGLNADLSSALSQGGIAIQRGALIAIAEINEAGGLFDGRKLELLTRDHRGIPDRGKLNVQNFINKDKVDLLLGGVHTPVVLSELEIVHQHKKIYLIPWAAGTPIIENGYDPNYVFRVSVRDEYAGDFITEYMINKGHKKIALLLETTPWGRSNEKAFKQAVAQYGGFITAVEWFNWGDQDFDGHLQNIEESGATAFVMVCNALEGVNIIKSLAKRPEEKRLPVFSHWGITGGQFYSQVQSAIKDVELEFLQTYSFLPANKSKSNQQFVNKYEELFRVKNAKEIFAPVGSAHSYDLIHLYALAVNQAQSYDSDQVRKALENSKGYQGLLKTYNQAFSFDQHDALTVSDFNMAIYDHEGVIRLVTQTE